MSNSVKMIGVMSGTSADGIDVAIVSIKETGIELDHYAEHPLPEKLRELVLRLAAPGIDEIDCMGALSRELGIAFARAIQASLKAADMQPADITAIASHGQTIRHRPKGVGRSLPFTLQIGDAATVAEQTGITTITGFRNRDIAAGGEGAPLAPFAHQLMTSHLPLPVAVLNVGGIANVTYIDRGQTTGFDTGPGNMVMDGLMLTLSDARNRYDENGELAASGKVNEKLLTELMQHPYFKRRPPKSSGREEFGSDIIDRILATPDISDADRIRTALELSVQSIAGSRQWMESEPKQWLVCGGGAYNGLLIKRLAEELAPAAVSTTQGVGIPPNAVEATAFALLGWHTLLGKPNTLASVTGASHDVCGGEITPGDNWPAVLEELRTWIRSPTP